MVSYNQHLSTVFQKMGIAHHVSYPHAHQQNGSSAYKHCQHIVKVSLSLITQASVPMKLGDEAFLMATYLINHIPSYVIDFSTSLNRQHHDKPNLLFFSSSIQLRLFGLIFIILIFSFIINTNWSLSKHNIAVLANIAAKIGIA